MNKLLSDSKVEHKEQKQEETEVIDKFIVKWPLIVLLLQISIQILSGLFWS